MRTRLLTLFTSLLLALPAVAQERVPSAEDAQALVTAGRFEQAVDAWKKRADADATDGRAHFMYAYCVHMTGDLDAAHDAHLAAARFEQFTQTALYNHACVHALRNEKDVALRSLREAIEAGFDNAEQLRTDGDLENLRDDGRFASLMLELEGTAPTRLASLPPARRFDFYVGDWSMRNGDTIERHLSVESAFDGNGLRVASTSPDGRTTANSIFLFDEDDGLWRQVWMNRDGMVVVLEGGLEGDAMVLRQALMDGEPKRNARSVFKNVGANGFTYEWQETRDGGASWETLATRTFTRRG
jgi:tetratricopeptide (TPR) repeat protein